MYTVFFKKDYNVFESGFNSYEEAYFFGWNTYGPKNFEIEKDW